MKKIVFSLFFLTIMGLLASPFALAATPSPTPKASASPKTSPTASPSATPKTSPTPSPSASPQAQEATAAKLKELIKQGTERVKGAMDQNGVQQRGFIGDVQRVTDKTVTIKTFKGNEILTVNSDVILTRDGKKATIDDLAIGDWAIAMGTTEKEVFTLKKLQISSTTLLPKTYVTVLATVKVVNKSAIGASERNKTEIVNYIINKNTVYQDNQGNKVDIKAIKPDFQYLLIGTQDDTGITLTTVRTLGN